MDSDSTSLQNNARDLSPPPPAPPPQLKEVKTIDTTNEQNKHAAYSVPVATAEPVLTPVETTMEVVRIVKANKFAGKSGEEAAATKIQTAFRGYLVCFMYYAFSCSKQINNLSDSSGDFVLLRLEKRIMQ